MLRRRLLFAHALIPALVSPQRKQLTYNTSEQELITSGTVKHGTLYYKLNNGEYSSVIPKGTDAGTYNVYYKVIGDEHYEDIEEQLLICTINKAQLNYTEPTPLSIVYDKTEHDLITPGQGGSPGTFYYRKNTDTWNTSIPKGTDAGYYPVSWKIDVNSNYYGVEPQSFEVLIEKANPILGTITPRTLTYNGNAQQLIDSVTTTGGSVVYCKDNQNGTYTIDIPTGTDAGEYTVYVKVLGNSNYNNSEISSVNCIINKANITVTAPKPTSGLIYDGQSKQLCSAGTTNFGTILYKLNSTGTYSTIIPTATEIGTYTIFYKVNGNSNYNDYAEHSITAQISDKIVPEVTPPQAVSTMTYNGSSKTLLSTAATTTGGTIQYSLNYGSNWSTSIPKATDAGTYNIYYRSLGDDTYATVEGTDMYVTTTINQAAALNSAPTRKSLTYNGSAQYLCNAGSTNNGTMEYSLNNSTWSTTIPTGTNVSSYTIYYRVQSTNSNYYGDNGSISSTINKRSALKSAPTSKSLTYTGSSQSLCGAGSTYSGTMEYSLNNSTWSTSIPTGSSVQTYTIYYRITQGVDSNHSTVSGTSYKITSYIYNPGTTIYVYHNGYGLSDVTVQQGSTTQTTNSGGYTTFTGLNSNQSYYYSLSYNSHSWGDYVTGNEDKTYEFDDDYDIYGTTTKTVSADTTSVTFSYGLDYGCSLGWTAQSDTNAVSVSNSNNVTNYSLNQSGKSVTITFPENTSYDNTSSHSITLSYHYDSITFTATQSAKEHIYSLRVSPYSIDTYYGSSSDSLSSVYLYIDGVKQNTNIKNSCTLSTDVNWITISGTSWTISSYSTYESTRTGTITVSYNYGGKTVYGYIDISQSGPEHTYSLEVSPYSDSYLYNGGARGLSSVYLYIDGVKQNTDIKSNCTLSTSQSWITINGRNWIIGSYDTYDSRRNGTITVSYNYGGKTVNGYIDISQSGPEHHYSLEVSPSSSSVYYSSSSGSLSSAYIYSDGTKLNTNVKDSCTLSTNQSWITISGTSWTISSYDTYESTRTGTITVSYNYGGKILTDDISISQSGPDHTYSISWVNSSDSNYTIDSASAGTSGTGNEFKYAIYRDGSAASDSSAVSVSSDSSWLTPKLWTSLHDIDISWTKNTGSTRTAILTLSYHDKTITSTITQPGSISYGIVVNPDSYSYNNGSNSGSLESVYLTENGSQTGSNIKTYCTLSTNDSWITISNRSWYIDSYSTYNSTRTGTITVSYTYNGETLTDDISISQSGRVQPVVSTITANVYVFKNGQSSDDADIEMTGNDGYAIEAIDGGSLTLNQNESYTYDVNPVVGVSFVSIVFENTSSGTYTSANSSGTITTGSSNMIIRVYLTS